LTTRSSTTPGLGIHVDDSTQNLIKGNRFSANGPSVLIEADGTEVRENRISRGGGIIDAIAFTEMILRLGRTPPDQLVTHTLT
jgi:parallel beta-helix repeat protein